MRNKLLFVVYNQEAENDLRAYFIECCDLFDLPYPKIFGAFQMIVISSFSESPFVAGG
jgi:hypothetical protein